MINSNSKFLNEDKDQGNMT